MYLEKMGGDIVNDSWKGGLPISYRYGPGFASPYQNRFTHEKYNQKIVFLEQRFSMCGLKISMALVGFGF